MGGHLTKKKNNNTLINNLFNFNTLNESIDPFQVVTFKQVNHIRILKDADIIVFGYISTKKL